MNWTKLSEKFPLVTEELKVFQEMVDLDGEFLIDEYILFNNEGLGFFRFPILEKIEERLKATRRHLDEKK